MIRIIADEEIPYLKGVLEPFASVVYKEGRKINRQNLSLADAMIIGTRTLCNRDLLEGTPVKFIATATIGYDHIDTEYCTQRGISWVNAPGCNSGAVQQYLASVFAHLAIRKGCFLKGKTAGIIGAGHVGRKVETLCRLLGMNVLLNDPPRARKEGSSGFVSLKTALRESDFVTLHVPLDKKGPDKTLDLIGKGELDIMKSGAWLFNTSRGAVIDEQALKNNLSAGKSAGVVLDVWRGEPDADQELISMTEIATPHIAGYSADGKRNATWMVLKSLADFFGLPFGNFLVPSLPEPENPVIFPQFVYKDVELNICQAFLQTYDIAADDQNFRNAPQKFDTLRKNYPLRREFNAYQIGEPENASELNRIWSSFSS